MFFLFSISCFLELIYSLFFPLSLFSALTFLRQEKNRGHTKFYPFFLPMFFLFFPCYLFLEPNEAYLFPFLPVFPFFCLNYFETWKNIGNTRFYPVFLPVFFSSPCYLFFWSLTKPLTRRVTGRPPEGRPTASWGGGAAGRGILEQAEENKANITRQD